MAKIKGTFKALSTYHVRREDGSTLHHNLTLKQVCELFDLDQRYLSRQIALGNRRIEDDAGYLTIVPYFVANQA